MDERLGWLDQQYNSFLPVGNALALTRRFFFLRHTSTRP